MKGVPSPDVKCRVCGSSPAWTKSGMCRSCLLRIQRGGCVWTREQDDMVRGAYAASSLQELRANVGGLLHRLGRSRTTVSRRARELGCTWISIRRPWTAQELELLRTHTGEWSINRFVKVFGRSHSSVLGAIQRVKLSRRISSGYTVSDVMAVLGASRRVVERWIEQGILPVREGRVPGPAMLAFLHKHPELYSLKHVDEQWYKATLFPGARCFGLHLRKAA